MRRYHSAVVSVSLLALMLAGCNKSSPDASATNANSGLPALPAALPMQTGPATQLVAAPPVARLPTRRYIGVSRPADERQRYAYLDRASDVEDEVGDAPPDYEYDNDDGVSPYVWQTGGGDYRYAEPTDDGYRYYYYQRGEDYPYLVRSHDYSYAYAGGALVAIYLLSGALLPPDQYGSHRDDASRYYWRGQDLRQASDQRQHQGVNAANWAQQRPQFSAAQANWVSARSQQPDWQAYHAQNDPSQQPGWQQEHQQRQQVAQQFSGWQSRGLAGAAPPALAAAGALAVVAIAAHHHGGSGQPGQQEVAGPAASPHPGMAGPQQNRAGSQGTAPPIAGPIPNTAVQATIARQQQLAAERATQQQGLANERLAQEASRARQQAALQQQQLANVNHQKELVAQEQTARRQALTSQIQAQEATRAQQQLAAQQQSVARQQLAAQRQAAVQQREALVAAHQAQAQAVAAQRHAEISRMQAPRPEPVRAPAPVQRPVETKPPAVHVEAPHPAPEHEKDHHPQ